MRCTERHADGIPCTLRRGHDGPHATPVGQTWWSVDGPVVDEVERLRARKGEVTASEARRWLRERGVAGV